MLARYWEGQEAKLENERESCGQQKHFASGWSPREKGATSISMENMAH